jgi:rare lipoprotein A
MSEAKTEINKTIAIDVVKKGTMVASWYGPKFDGKPTANTETFNQLAYTAAHKSLPFGTMLKVTNPANGKSVIVRINDRGPYIKGRDIDLSKGAAIALGMVQKGVIKVEVEKLVPRLSNS